MKYRTYAVTGLLIMLAACSATGSVDEPKEDAVDPRGDAAPSIADSGAPEDAAPSADGDAERPLVCGDAGFCETRLPKSDHGEPLSLRRVWAVGSNDVWSLTLEGYVLHYDGTAWTIVYRANHELYAVWATPTSVWVGGEAGLLLHRGAAGEWSRVETGHLAPIRAIYGTGDSDVWFSSQGGVDHFDGTKLKNYPIDVPGLEVTTVFGLQGFGTYAAGYVKGTNPEGGFSFADQPYVFTLSTDQVSVFNPALTEQRDFVPVSGFVTDAPDENRRIFLFGHQRIRLVFETGTMSGVIPKVAFVGGSGPVAISPVFSISVPERLKTDWGLPILMDKWNEIRFLPNTGNIVRWDGASPWSGFTSESLAMGYSLPTATIFGAHRHASGVWVVGDGFALKGATP